MPDLSQNYSAADRKWITAAAVLWISFAVALTVKAFVVPGSHTVYPIFVVGSERWIHDLPIHVQDPSVSDLFRYTPTFAVLFTPFAVLPPALGQALWGLFSVGGLFFSLYLAARKLLPGEWPLQRRLHFYSLSLVGSLSGLWSGQTNSLILAFAIFASVCVLEKRWTLAAVCLTLPIYVKLWPVALAMLLIAHRPKELAWRFALCMLVFAAIPFFTKPYGEVVLRYQEWIEFQHGLHQVRWGGYRDFWTIWETLWPPVSSVGYMALQLISAFGVFLWCMRQKFRALDEKELLVAILSMWTAWQLLFGPGTEQLTYCIIGPWAAWAVLQSWPHKLERIWTVAAWGVLSFFTCGEIERPFDLLMPATKTLAPLAVFAFVVWLVAIRRAPKEKA